MALSDNLASCSSVILAVSLAKLAFGTWPVLIQCHDVLLQEAKWCHFLVSHTTLALPAKNKKAGKWRNCLFLFLMSVHHFPYGLCDYISNINWWRVHFNLGWGTRIDFSFSLSFRFRINSNTVHLSWMFHIHLISLWKTTLQLKILSLVNCWCYIMLHLVKITTLQFA